MKELGPRAFEAGRQALLRGFLAAFIIDLMVAGAETLVGFPRPSSPALASFNASLAVYLPVAIVACLGASLTSPVRGLNLWLPLTVGVVRMASGLVALTAAQEWGAILGAVLALSVVLKIRSALESPTGSPPFLFGLTVGIVLPILGARIALLSEGRLGGRERALVMGVLGGLVFFVLLRAFVARWPRVGPVFLLGPAVSLLLWSRNGSAPSEHRSDPPSAFAPSARPDIVLIVLDTVRAQSVSPDGRPIDTMPGLTRFGREAAVFSHAWTSGSWTLPGHASLFSGLSLSHHRYDSGFPLTERLEPNRFLAEQLRRQGYATAAVVANFGVLGRDSPLLRGFESVDSEPLRPAGLRPWFFDLIFWFPRVPWLSHQAARFPGPSVRAPWVVDRALRFWSMPRNRPRFLFVNLMEAHLPWIPEPEDLGRFGPPGLNVEREQLAVLGRYLKGGRPTPAEAALLRARYEESLHSLDRQVSRLLEGVTSSTHGQEPLVVVTSDHGESLGEHDRFGHRHSLDEESTRVPLFIRGAGIPHGVNPAPVQITDVFGYLAAAGGVPPALDLDTAPLGARRYVILEHRPGPQGALPDGYPRGDLSAIVDWPYKYGEGALSRPVLFDLSSDPGEFRNLAAADPIRVEAMGAVLRRLSTSSSLTVLGPDRAAEERQGALGYLR